MDIKEIIEKKQRHIIWSKEEINFVVNGFVKGSIKEKQMTEFLKVIYKLGMSQEEVFYLTDAMKNSGEVLDLKDLGQVVDKHSSGGVGDNTTLIIVPILASLGVKMLKMSGGGLGFTGGTADKVKSKWFGGLQNELDFQEAKNIVKNCNGVFLTQSEKLVPADKKIYALRNKTGLIESIPLIASSIVSKKLACGADIILLDVKYGDGAFMKNIKLALELAKMMVAIIKKDGKKACATITSMEEPLGSFIGDELEVREAILILQNKIRNKLSTLSIFLASKILSMAKGLTMEDAKKAIYKTIDSGKALESLRKIVEAQGGHLIIPEDKLVEPKLEVTAQRNGYIMDFKTEELGFLTKKMAKKFKDFVGVEVLKSVGDEVRIGDPIFNIYFNRKTRNIADLYQQCVEVGDIKYLPSQLIFKVIV